MTNIYRKGDHIWSDPVSAAPTPGLDLAGLLPCFYAYTHCAEDHEHDCWAKRARLAVAPALLAAAERAEAVMDDAAHLAANQCHDGYGDDWGNHRCRVVDTLTAERDALRERVAALERVAEAAAETLPYLRQASDDGDDEAQRLRVLLCSARAALTPKETT
jgi:hypothetical protein